MFCCILTPKTRNIEILIVFIQFIGIFGVYGYTLNDSITLMKDMLRNYDRRHRPIENQSMPIKVSNFNQTPG